jgi:hypothetical protein
MLSSQRMPNTSVQYMPQLARLLSGASWAIHCTHSLVCHGDHSRPHQDPGIGIFVRWQRDVEDVVGGLPRGIQNARAYVGLVQRTLIVLGGIRVVDRWDKVDHGHKGHHLADVRGAQLLGAAVPARGLEVEAVDVDAVVLQTRGGHEESGRGGGSRFRRFQTLRLCMCTVETRISVMRERDHIRGKTGHISYIYRAVADVVNGLHGLDGEAKGEGVDRELISSRMRLQRTSHEALHWG